MKVKTSLKKRGKYSKLVRRNGRIFVINKINPRFKQRQS